MAKLKVSLRSLEHDAAAAIQRISEGERIDAHMIANRAMLTATIARWNMLCELRPYMNKEEE